MFPVPILSRLLRACLPAALLLPSALARAEKAPLSDRIVAYRIDAKYDAKTHSLDARETLTYTNRTGQALDRFPFHLYLNGFQPKATWIREAHAQGSRDFDASTGWDPKKAGSNDITSLTVEGMGDLTQQIRFISPDDGNPDDRTVCEVALPRPVPPGASITFHIGFKAKFPEVVARTGYKRDFILAGQWFPKVGVFWKGAWNCHQFHASTEFFADFGTYDVAITLPQAFHFGSTGVLTGERKNADGTKTLTVHADDVHDFAWTADPNYQLLEDDITLGSGKVQIRVLMQPGREDSKRRYVEALKGTMRKFEEWYGPYPYPQITVVDPPHGGGAAGGMEYPMFITADTAWFIPKGMRLPEIVTEHEFGHQYWYGMVATNEFEDAWLDEGINQYTEGKVMDALYGRDTSMFKFAFATAGERAMNRFQYAGIAEFDPMTRNGWEYVTGGAYGGTTYSKTATVLNTLEQLVGEATVRKALHTYFMRYRFTHPTEEDFMATVNEVVGQDLGWFWDQAVKGTHRMDYRIMRARSERTDWFQKQTGNAKKGETLMHTEVVVHRKGDFQYPVTLVVTFDNGEVLTERWDGKERWKRWEWDKKASVLSAEINADGGILLDLNRFNDSYVAKPDDRASSKIRNTWMAMSQWFGQLLGWLV